MKLNLSKQVSENKYYDKISKKHQIVICNSYSSNIDYMDKWNTRCGGSYKNTVPYSIDLDGTVYEHFNPKYSSEITGFDTDENLIGVNLINEGWLSLGKDNEYFNTFRTIYKREYAPLNIEWRGKEYWTPYTKEQMTSLVDLCTFLCNKFNIETTTMTHNTKVTGISDLKGIVYRSNYSDQYRDVSPTFNFNYLIEKLKEYEINGK